MPIGIREDHEELRRTVRRWLEARCPPEVPRALLDAPTETMPPFWDELASPGWLGIHAPPRIRRAGLRQPPELAVVVERWLGVMPGPLDPTMLAAAVITTGADDTQRKALLPAHGPTAQSPPWPCPAPAPDRGTGRRRHALFRCTASFPLSSAPPWSRACWSPSRSRAARPMGVIDLGDGVTTTALASLDPARRVRGRCRCRGCRWAPNGSCPASRAPPCATWRSSWPRRSVRAGRAGASTWAPPTPSSGANSAVPSASSRPSSTGWPTCWWRWSRPPPWPGTRLRPPTPGTRPRSCCRPSWPGRSSSTPTSTAGSCIGSWGAWASPGSTTPTSTSAGPCRCASSSAPPGAAGRGRRTLALDLPRGRRSRVREDVRALVAPRWGGVGPRPSDAGAWSTPGSWPRTGRRPGGAGRDPSNSSSSTRRTAAACAPASSGRGRLGLPRHHRPRHRRAAGALGGADPAR